MDDKIDQIMRNKRFLIAILLLIIIINIFFGFYLLNEKNYNQALNSTKPVNLATITENKKTAFPSVLLADNPVVLKTNKEIDKPEKKQPNKNISVLLVSDVGQLQAMITEKIIKSNSQPIKNIIILSSAVTGANNDLITTNNSHWKTSPFFLYPIRLNESESIPIQQEENIFENHKMTGMRDTLKNAFPKARILPILQKDQVPETASIDLADRLTINLSPENTLVIAIVEWSHDLYPEIIEFQDITATQILSSREVNNVERLNTHSTATLRTALKMVDNWGYNDFKVAQTSLLKAQEKKDNSTSTLHGYFMTSDRKNKAIVKKATTLLLGDVMLDRFMRRTIEKHGFNYLLNNKMNRFLRGTDITLVNFESAMTRFRPHKARNRMMTFTSSPSTAPNLAAYGINMASLANNHSLNFGKEGFEQTKLYLGDSGIETFGTPFNRTIGGNVYSIRTLHGIRVAFIGYHELYESDLNPILEQIEKLKPHVDFITIVAHWGAEYGRLIPRYQQKSAHKFIDAGADLIVGHHPHVVQPMEVYKNKMIFYSLGNFLFDQRGKEKLRVRLAVGISYECSISKKLGDRCLDKRIVARLFPLYSNRKYQVFLMSKSKKKKFFKWFGKHSKI